MARGWRRRALGAAAGALAAVLLAGCALAPAPAPETPPRLAVLFIIDGLAQRELVAQRDAFGPDGFARFLTQGAVFEQAHYGHAHTVTAAGHAAIATGAYPQRSGIIANEWIDPASGERRYCTGDAAENYLGGHATGRFAGTSPRLLLAPTLADSLRAAQPQARAIAVSGKDRGAILSVGRAGTPYIYMPASGRFASTSFYLREHPPWVVQFDAARPADRWFGQAWHGRPLAPAEATAPNAAYWGALQASPHADALALEFALAAIAGEGLGADAVPDLLVLSLSAHDTLNHRYSAESPEAAAHLLALDRLLQDFFAQLDARIGREAYVAALSADHGFMPKPETVAGGGRYASADLMQQVNARLRERWGAGSLLRFMSASGLVLNRAAIAQRGLDFDAVADSVRDALLAQPAVAAAYTRRELEEGTRAGAPHFEAVRRSWHRERSADVQFVPRPFWMPGQATATHGSPHAYDTHVPLLFWGPRWVAAQRRTEPVAPVDLAPTLAALLGVPAPAASEGRVLRLQ